MAESDVFKLNKMLMKRNLLAHRKFIQRIFSACFVAIALSASVNLQIFAQDAGAPIANPSPQTNSGTQTTQTTNNNSTTPAPQMPFAPVEYLVYEGEYSKLLLRGIKVAELRFAAQYQNPASAGQAASDQNINPLLLFTGDVESQGFFRKLFSLNFHYQIESSVQTDMFRTLRTNKLDEQNKRVRTSVALFDYAKNKVTWTERDPNQPRSDPRVISSDLNGATLDILSGLYALRMRPLAVGDKFEMRVSESGAVYSIPVRVVERKKIKSVLGEGMTLRLDLDMFGDNRLVRGEGEFSIWLTDDARRVPVKARINHKLGTLDITLKSISNQRMKAEA